MGADSHGHWSWDEDRNTWKTLGVTNLLVHNLQKGIFSSGIKKFLKGPYICGTGVPVLAQNTKLFASSRTYVLVVMQTCAGHAF